MQENYLFEYAVIRVVPKVEREEFLNIGVILYCPKQKFLEAVVAENNERLTIFSGQLDMDELNEHLTSFINICRGGKDCGPIGVLDMASRFRWLTACRSTILQTSKVHPGLCISAPETIEKLFRQMVL